LTVTVAVPFNTRAVLILPDAELSDLKVPNQPGLEKMTQEGNTVHVELKAGEYQFTYNPTIPYRKIYSLDSPMDELNENPKTKAILDETFYKIHKVLPFEKELYTLREMLNGPFTNLPYTEQAEIDRRLREVK
jgi:alpha-L-rhamnosidase